MSARSASVRETNSFQPRPKCLKLTVARYFQKALYTCKISIRFFGAMPIRGYLDGQRFPPETIRLMGIAFETAIQAPINGARG